MISLETNFAGLHLNNPIIVSSSGLTNSAIKNQKLQEAGAAAIVLKSLFQEQIMMNANHLDTNDYPEANEYLKTYSRSHALKDYINLIKESKELCSIPIIASINCFNNSEWSDFSLSVQEAGADALELNILSLETDKDGVYGAKEQNIINVVAAVKKEVSIPIIVKIGYHISNPIALINQIYANQAAGVVMFNRTYQTDIDIEHLTYTTGDIFTSTNDLSDRLRWTAISSSIISNIDYAISGGIHSGVALIKSILVGASAGEICSVLYKRGNEVIKEIKEELEEWMRIKCYTSINQFKGCMNANSIEGINPFERTQFMKYYSNHD